MVSRKVARLCLCLVPLVHCRSNSVLQGGATCAGWTLFCLQAGVTGRPARLRPLSQKRELVGRAREVRCATSLQSRGQKGGVGSAWGFDFLWGLRNWYPHSSGGSTDPLTLSPSPTAGRPPPPALSYQVQQQRTQTRSAPPPPLGEALGFLPVPLLPVPLSGRQHRITYTVRVPPALCCAGQLPFESPAGRLAGWGPGRHR